jgi:hypothetical protein
MATAAGNSLMQKTTSWKIVVPFYLYAAVSFLCLTALLCFSASALEGHYFHPRLLAITHLATLGWGTMVILGASHQLIPVLIDGKLYSEKLALATFYFIALGIPFLADGFWHFQTNWIMQGGALLVLTGIFLFVLNTLLSVWNTKQPQVQVYFLFTATLWLLLTAIIGTLLVFNFSYNIFSESHLHYLRLHAHMGLGGWFLLLIIGVASRLIPMFLISKYNNNKLLWTVYALINGALILFLIDALYDGISERVYFYLAMILTAVALFSFYCYKAWQARIRKKVEIPVRLALIAVGLLLLPVLIAFLLVSQLREQHGIALRLTIVYGSLLLLGWMTAIILGMTFKTLPFIIWNKVYHSISWKQATPSPKDLFSNRLVKWQAGFYLPGLLLFETGVLILNEFVIRMGAVLLLLTAIVYCINMGKLVSHKIKPSGVS